MELIPAIDLMNGKCVRLFKGDFNKRKDLQKSHTSRLNFGKAKEQNIYI